VGDVKKRTSKRRWKARIALGRWIPYFAILNHRLTFPGPTEVAHNADCYRLAR
jgi:hypothetical protein